MSEPTPLTSTYAVLPMNATSIGPPLPMPKSEAGRPLANVVTAPDSGSTREMLPVLSVKYSAPSGPTVLPLPPSRPEASSVAVGGPELWAPTGLRPASCPGRGAVVWSQPATNTPAQIAASPFEIESRSMVNLNDMVPPGQLAVNRGTVFPVVLVERNRVPKRLTCACQILREHLCWESQRRRRHGVHAIGGHSSPEAMERGRRARARSAHPPGL